MNHKYIYNKKITSIILALVLVMGACSCKPVNLLKSITEPNPNSQIIGELSSPTDNEEFEQFLKDMFADEISQDLISLHAFIEHPADFGIKEYDTTFGRYELDKLGDTTEITNYITTLNSYDREKLSAKQQISYDQLLQLLQTNLEYSDLYLFDTQLQTTTGLHIQLPLLMAEYTFAEKKDIDEYLLLLEDTDEFLADIIEFEKLRAASGYFMEDKLADMVIESCNSFLSTASNDNSALISTFNERLAGFTGLTEAEISEYKTRNVNAVNNHVIPGYQALVSGITALKGTNKYPGGVCNYPDGKRYYEYLLKSTIGWNKTVDEYNALLDSYLKTNMLSMQMLMLKDPAVYDMFESFSFNMTDPSAILEDLKKRMTDDFPEIPEVKYDIKYISEALEDFASPAMYFLPQIDNLDVNSIYINNSRKNSDELYPTLAHEGYPGHLYQTQYFASTNPHWIRYIISPGGYVEGWASYTEVLSYKYAQTGNETLNTLYGTNYATILCIYAKGDIGVNYYNWSIDDLYKFISSYGFDDRSIAEEMYYAFISDPGNYCKYVLGMLGFEELKKQAVSELGDSFVLKDFHKYVLDIGPVQFDILFSNLPAWISRQKNKTL